MNRPKFGKWYTLAEATPKDGQVVLFKVKGQVLIGDYEITHLNEELFTHSGVSYYAQEWMPRPNAEQDAFTELRAKLDEWEQGYNTDLVNLDLGIRTANLSQYRETKIACCKTALLLIKKIREVIE